MITVTLIETGKVRTKTAQQAGHDDRAAEGALLRMKTERSTASLKEAKDILFRYILIKQALV